MNELKEQLAEEKAKSVEWYLNNVSYNDLDSYIPSDFAFDFVNIIKLIHDGHPENKTPTVHYKVLDSIVANNNLDTINMCHRGFAKSSLKEYLLLYFGLFGELPNFGKVPYGLYVSDSVDNGVKKMRKSLEFKHNNSNFLQTYIPKIKFTDDRWEFINKSGNSFVCSGFGAKTGLRGTRENNSRPVIALLDDLISDEDARSPTVIANVEDIVSKAVEYALHPTKRKVIWSGTPFNAGDPLYKAVESGAYNVNVFPVCEKFPCTREEFRGSWPERFTFDSVKRQYDKAKATGKLASFNQEMMLRIMSEEDRLIQDSDIKWFSVKALMKHRSNLNFYITTDFATSEKTAADYSVISVWAVNSSKRIFLVDGICKQQTMDKNVNDLFRLVAMYKPVSVGIEVTGQQGGFIPWIEEQMMDRNIFFSLASDGNQGRAGIRPTTNKMVRFNVVLPYVKAGLLHLPEELKGSDIVQEAVEELRLATPSKFKSKHDDWIDTFSMIGLMQLWYPSDGGSSSEDGEISRNYWEDDNDVTEISRQDSYIV